MNSVFHILRNNSYFTYLLNVKIYDRQNYSLVLALITWSITMSVETRV